MNTILHLRQPAHYRLSLQGRVTADWTDWLTDVDIRVNGAEDVTVVTGTVRDQTALFGLLSFVRDLGVPLIAVDLISS